ncbi:GPW/gp25 family protein [Elizabethkingia anophelis]|uniref:GPW/gp25 family protein n=1 Tax=Elizabethkingia anophelis TaxID=1117645 RepID=UPI00136BFFAA|nr:GPW/gp25 family protein [Elizabethkingia anophelis]MYY27268.1 lysozyme [Elizabethkingia anophelis]
MEGMYYKIPINFSAIIDGEDIDKVSIGESIDQHLFIIVTTPYGTCKFDNTYGTEIFQVDFDLLRNDNSIKEFISKTIAESVTKFEKRLFLEDIEIVVKNTDIGVHKKRVKKKVIISIKGIVIETDRPFFFHKSFFIGPLSY